MKKLLTALLISLSLCTTASMALTNDNTEFKPDSYTKYSTHVAQVDAEEDRIIVSEKEDSKDNPQEQIIFQNKYSKIFDAQKGEFVKDHKFKKDEKIIAFVKNNTPMTMSLPPITNPQFIIVNPYTKYSVDVDYFTKEKTGQANRLTINSLDKAQIKTIDGKDLDTKDIFENQLFVVYTTSTRSLPPITNPEKVFVIKENEKTNTIEEILKENQVKDQDLYKLRNIMDSLKITVNWNAKDKTIILKNNDKEATINTVKKMMQIDDMIVKLDNMKIENSTTCLNKQAIETIINNLK